MFPVVHMFDHQDMMEIKINKQKIQFPPHSSESDVYCIIKNKMCWPKCNPYLTWDNNQVEVENDTELHFVSKMIAEELYHDFQSQRHDFFEVEKSLAQNVDEEESDQELHSEDDITQELFYQMGYRREIT